MKAVTYLKQFLSPKAMCLIIGGSLVYSIGFNMFILPCNLYNGGFLGIAQLLGYFMRNVLGLSFVTDSYIGIIYFLLNIPLMLLAIRVCILCIVSDFSILFSGEQQAGELTPLFGVHLSDDCQHHFRGDLRGIRQILFFRCGTGLAADIL